MSEHNSSRGGSGALFSRINGERQIARRIDSFFNLVLSCKDTRHPFRSVIRNQHPMKDDAFTGLT